MQNKVKNVLRQIRMYWVVKRSGLFDREYYLRNNLDVARSCVNPIKHYIRHGWREGRKPNKFFDTKWYLKTYPDVAKASINPLYHYIKHGVNENRYLSPGLSTCDYLTARQNMAITGADSLTRLLGSKQFKYENNASWCYRVSEEELLDRVRKYNAQKNKRKAKVVVYTAIIGGYDQLILPEYITDDWDYVLFSDVDIPGEHIFEVRKPDYYNIDPTRSARYIKMHPHVYFPEYEYAVWIDSNIMVRGPHMERALNYCSERDILLMSNPHPHRNCVYDELAKCIALGKDDPNTMTNQVDRYREEGLPEGVGMLETNIFLRKHNDTRVKTFNEEWWKEIEKYSRRDQLSVMYVLWKKGLPYEVLPDVKNIRVDNNDYCVFVHYGQTGSTLLAYSTPPFMRQPMSLIKERGNNQFSLSYLTPLRNERIDIVVCVHNALQDVKRCLESVLVSLLPTHRVIVVDDGSDADTQVFLRDLVQTHPQQLSLIRNKEAKGYTKAANMGLKSSDAPFVILLNSDTIVAENWAVKMLQTASSAPDIGVVGPMSNAASWQSLPLVKDTKTGRLAVNKLPQGKSVADMDCLCEKFGYFFAFPRVPLVNGFCYGIKRQVLDAIGYLDEDAFPRGYSEEDDFSMRALDAGFTHAIATHCYVYHGKSKSFGGSQRDKLAKIGGGILRSRHGESRINRATQSMSNNPFLRRVRLGVGAACGIQTTEKVQFELPLPLEVQKEHITSVATTSEVVSASVAGYDLDCLTIIAPQIFPHELTLAKITAEELDANATFVRNMRGNSLNYPKIVTWFLPNFPNILRGGVRTIFMTAENFSKEWGTKNYFVLYKTSRLELSHDKDEIQRMFPDLRFSLAYFEKNQDPTRLPESDIAFCSSWPTAYLLARYNKCKAKFYFMQDYESLFYPAGSVQALIEHTYRFGFYCIANTKGIADKYRMFSEDVDFFVPGVDRNIYSPPVTDKAGPPYQVVFYGRPRNKRNAFALGVEALKQVKAHFGDAVRIISVGADWNPSKYGLEGVIENLGVLKKLEDVAHLYKQCHIGLVFMLTPHSSYQPLEYMACGCVTVTNENPDVNWLFKNGENAVLTSTVPDDVARKVILALEDDSLRKRIVKGGLETVEQLNWDIAFKKIRDFVENPQKRTFSAS